MKYALVTGANRGIGLEVCKQLLEKNYFVFLGARNKEKGMKARATLGDLPNLKVIELDVTSPSSVQAAAKEMANITSILHLLINNAGINYDTWNKTETAELEQDVKSTFETNFFGVWRVTQAFLPLLKAAKGAHIVNVSSGIGSIASMSGETPGYATSKAALNALTANLAGELKNSNIVVNAVCPGWIATDMGGAGGGPVEDGAKSVLWAAYLPEEGPTGGFYRHGKRLPW